MVYRIVPREKIGTAMGMYGLGIIFAPAIGPALGGYLVEYVNWRLIFYINVPDRHRRRDRRHRRAAEVRPGGRARRFDVFGFLTIAAGLVVAAAGLLRGPSWGWTSYRILILIIGGVLLLALFVVIELEVDQPLLDLRVFRYRAYTQLAARDERDDDRAVRDAVLRPAVPAGRAGLSGVRRRAADPAAGAGDGAC